MSTSTPDEPPIVVGVDGSESAGDAVAWAAGLAAAWEAPLHLLHAGGSATGEAPAWLQEFTDAATRAGAEVACTQTPGETTELLVRSSMDARLLVVGSYGEGARSGMLAGSVALALIERAGCPVAVVRGSAPHTRPPSEGPVVVGVDGTASADAALEFAALLAATSGTRLLVVHTWSAVVSDSDGAAHRLPDDGATLGERAVGILDDALARVRDRRPELPVEGNLVEGSPLRAVLDRVEGARAVVVGHHAGLLPTTMSVTSTGRGLVGFASCPVVVVGAAAGPASGTSVG